MPAETKKANPMITPNKLGLTKKDYQGLPSTLCTGCGHDSISMHLVSAFYELGIEPHRVAKLSGIGCSSKTPAYFLNRAHGFNSVHGRMPSVATGAYVANNKMICLGVSGDGDSASIGLGQLCHVIRRNLPLVYIIENNGVYGLTKGQFSATSEKGAQLKKGEINQFDSVDICSLAVDLGCDFVARSFSGDVKQLLPLIKAAIAHEGCAILDVISPCTTFNNHEGSRKSYPYVKEHEEYLHEIGFVQNTQEIQVDYEEGSFKNVEMHDGSVIRLRKLGRDYDPTDRLEAKKAIQLSKQQDELLTGLFYVNPNTENLGASIELSQKPLVDIPEQELKPSPEAFKNILDRFI